MCFNCDPNKTYLRYRKELDTSSTKRYGNLALYHAHSRGRQVGRGNLMLRILRVMAALSDLLKATI